MQGWDTQGGLVQTIIRNVAGRTAGRVLTAGMRFAIAIMIMRRLGIEAFGDYALVLSFMLVAEWLADFGQTDIAVRQLSAAPSSRRATLAALGVAKLACGGGAAVALCASFFALGYPPNFLAASPIAALAVLFYAVVIVYRADFRARLRADLDVGAEVIATFVEVVLVSLVTSTTADLQYLIGCFAFGRLINAALSARWANIQPQLSFAHDALRAARKIAREGFPLGVAGLLVALYDAMDTFALSQWSSSADVGAFSAANRLLMLAVIAAQAIGQSIFPVLARQWTNDRKSFRETMQASLNSSMIIGGLAVCGLHGSAQGIEQLFNQPSGAIGSVLQIIVWALFARVITSVLWPMIVVSGRQVYTVWMTALIVVTKAVALSLLVPVAGAMGAALALLIAEVAVSLIPTIYLCEYLARTRLNWLNPLRIVLCAALVVVISRYLGFETSLIHGILMGGAFLVLVAATGVLPVVQIRTVLTALSQRRGADPAVAATNEAEGRQ